MNLARPALLRRGALFCLAVAAVCPPLAGQDRRQEDLASMRVLSPTLKPKTGRINAVDETWEGWQKRTGELPPDFASMPSHAFLPDPLAGVRTPEEWTVRRQEIRAQLEHWLTGRMPPAPDNLRAVITGERREGEVLVRDVRLEFGPGHRATLRIQLLIPPHQGRLPVFLTNHNRARPWAATAVARGYIGCIYYATDPYYGEDDDSDKFIEVYPDYDFSCLARWAWAASRAVDYLVKLPEVDAGKIAIAGHSRNGKQAAFAAAFDERIAAAIPSSGNTGEANPWRFTSDPYANETMERIIGVNPHWFHPRLRFFIGRENKLPFDQNSLFALIAPRAVLLTSAYTEYSNSALGFEQNFRSLKSVYNFLGAPQNVGLRFRPGIHATTVGDIEAYLDFTDAVFGRRASPVPDAMIFGYSFEDWKSLSGETIPRVPAKDRLRWALGDEPPQVPISKPSRSPDSFVVGDGWIRAMAPLPADARMKVVTVPFGVDLKADLYLPAKGAGRKPLVVWLHPYAHASGYVYNAKAPFLELTRRGYAVLSFDHIGYGTRIEHAKDFYRRYPHWSLLGKMVTDTRAALAAVRESKEIDPARIYLVGYALGAKVALWTAAFDPLPAAVVSVAGVTPLRTSRDVESIRTYSHLHGLLPRLGFYADSPGALPLDYDDVIRAIGPRPILMVAPTHDCLADLGELRKLARPFSNVDLKTPEDFNRFTKETQTLVFDWLDQHK